MANNADDVMAAAGVTADAWATGLDHDWSGPARGMQISCWSTAEHLCDVVYSYAAQLAAQPTTGYVKLLLKAEDGAGPADLVQGLRAAAGILAAVVRSTGPEVRAYHPTGLADAEGFAAMAITELLLHGDDVTTALGLDFEPPQALCDGVLNRLFPDVEPVPDRWLTLRWATGRAELAGRDHVTGWRWHGAPRDG
jgi:hypothetical protein